MVVAMWQSTSRNILNFIKNYNCVSLIIIIIIVEKEME